MATENHSFWGEVVKAGNTGGVLRKIRFDLVNLGYTQDLDDKVKGIGGRISHHLRRLLEPERTKVENDFGAKFADLASDILPKFRKSKKVIESEGFDTCMWWTLAPYIYDDLKSRVGDSEAVKKLLDWAKTGEEFSTEEIKLKGLERYNSERGKLWFVLSEDPDHYSHKLAKREADRLVEEGVFD